MEEIQMRKFLNTMLVFEEIPDKISLAVNMTNCQNKCVGCHSPQLRKDIGKELTEEVVDELIKENEGINCFLFMGEGNDKDSLIKMARYIKEKYASLSLAIYSGRDNVEDDFYKLFDYVKIGPYIAKFGPLNKDTTNQRLLKIEDGARKDITSMFWKKF